MSQKETNTGVLRKADENMEDESQADKVAHLNENNDLSGTVSIHQVNDDNALVGENRDSFQPRPKYLGLNKAELRWNQKFQLLVKYHDAYKSTVVPNDHMLSRWVNEQRHMNRIGKLTDYRRQQLESIGFLFDPCAVQWMEMYQRLVEYKQDYQTTRVPRNVKKYKKLGLWVNTQRQRCNQKDRVDLLNAIGFDWGTKNSAWMEMYQRIVEYELKHGTTEITYNDDPKLATWVAKQRRECTKENRINLLNALQFEWFPDEFFTGIDSEWMEMFGRLVEYKQKYNDTRVPFPFEEDPKLGHWVARQRERCGRKDRVDNLNSIGFDWSGMDSNSVEIYIDSDIDEEARSQFSGSSSVEIYIDSDGDEEARSQFSGSSSMEICVDSDGDEEAQSRSNNADMSDVGPNARENHKTGSTASSDHAWKEMYRRLVQYKQKHHDTRVPYIFEEDQKLANWVRSQRIYCKREDRIELLNSIGFVWNTNEYDWFQMYQRLVQYKHQHDSTLVPNDFDDTKLVNWVRYQRRAQNENRQQKDRVDLLNAIGFIWKQNDLN